MALRLGAGAALVAVALLGFTVAVPQDASLGLDTSVEQFVKPWRGGENVDGLDRVDLDDEDLGDLLDRLDGAGLDPDLAENLDPAALAALLDSLDPDELAALGLTPDEAAALAARLRDPDLTDAELAAIAAGLADRGLTFANADADGRFDAGESAYADLDGDGRVSEGDVRLGVLALLLGYDRGLSEEARTLLQAYERAGAAALSRPATAASRATATAGTAALSAAGLPTDRAIGPPSVVCVPLYSPSLTCHTRTFVQEGVQRDGDHYVFSLDAARTPLVPEPAGSGPRATGRVWLDLEGGAWTPVPGLTPGDRLVASDDSSIELARDGNGMVWARGPLGRASVNLTWAVDLAYYDLPLAADVRAEDVEATLRPRLDAATLAVGLHLADLAGASDRAYGDGIRAVADFVRGWGVGPLPDRDEQPDDLLAYAEARVGCARHRAEALVVAVQALGVPARVVLNEAHAYAEVYVPKAGWHLVDAGACGQLAVRSVPGHAEVMAHQDLPYAAGDEPASQADAGTPATPTAIDITQVPATLRRNVDFTIAGAAASPAGHVPEGIPITFTYNRTKETPGTPFCSTQTQDGGAYSASCRLGPGTPAGSLQLVARLAPSVVAGAPSAIAYSDPPFTVQKATNVTMAGPARTSAGLPVAYTAHVLDEDGLAVVGRSVALRIDGDDEQVRFTDASGRARFTVQLPVGAHTLRATLNGDDSYDPSSGALAIEATTTALAVRVDPANLEAGKLTLEGALATPGGPQAGRSLTVRWRNDPDGSEQVRSATTGRDGSFRVTFDGLVRPGPGLASALDPASGVGVDVAFARGVDAHALLGLPERWTLGAAVPLTVTLTGSGPPVPLQVLVDGQRVADVAAGEQAPGDVLLTMAAGTHTVTLQPGEGVRLVAAPATVTLAPVNITLAAVPVQAPGAVLHLTGALQFGSRGLDGLVRVRGAGAQANGISDGDGAFALEVELPEDAPAGAATLLFEAPQVGFQHAIAVQIQRSANLAIDAPRLSLQAFGSTSIVVRGEGNVTVFAGDQRLGDGGRLEVPSQTWLVRRVHLLANAVPGSPDLAPATATTTMTVVNPVTLAALPVGLALAALAVTRTVGLLRRRHAHRNRFLPMRPRGPVQVLEPPLLPRAPLAFDPAQDERLVVRLPRRGPWSVRDARGRPVPARSEGRLVRIDLREIAPGRQRLQFSNGRRVVHLDCLVADLRWALDDQTLGILRRIGQTPAWPAPLDGFEQALADAGARRDDAAAVRRTAEQALYMRDQVPRDLFHAFLAAVDAAQARRPA